MAERTVLKARNAGIDFAEPIANEAAIATTTWKEQPLTLRDDEVSIVEGEPETKEVFSHENDSPEDYDISGAGLTATGSFIKVDYAQMADLLGGIVSGTGADKRFLRSSKKVVINKAIRFRFKDGSSAILPNAKGYVLLNLNAGVDGVLKHPFSFKSIAQKGFDCDIIIQ